jgi:hypothetical protein
MENGIMRSRVFIGSSSESAPFALAIERNLHPSGFEVIVWSKGVFHSGSYVLESLLEELDSADFGVFVLAADDVVRIRGKQLFAPRDNVVFELGLFIGRLGRQRVFAVSPFGEKLKMPSDLEGVLIGSFSSERSDQNLTAALSPACSEIADLMRGRKTRPKTSPLLAALGARVAARRDPDIRLYTFCGQLVDPAPDAGQEMGLGSVFRLWTDPSVDDNRIMAQLVDLGRAKAIRLRFENNGDLPGDATIRPCGSQALANDAGKKYLVLDVLARKEAALNAISVAQKRPLGLAVRLIDALATQWCYQRGDMRRMFEVPVDDRWHALEIDLEDASSWHVFEADGNHRYAAEQPDFSVIPGLVLEVGSAGGAARIRPGRGTGELHVAHIRLGGAVRGPGT